MDLYSCANDYASDFCDRLYRFFDAEFCLKEPDWFTPYEELVSTPIGRVLSFGGEDRSIEVTTLIVPPQAGHSSHIADYGDRKSLVQTCLNATNGRVLSIEWKRSTQSTKYASVVDLLDLIDYAVDTCSTSKVNLVGLCQGGWLSAIYAALYPQKIRTLTIAGAPIDFHIGNGYITKLADNTPMWLYELMVDACGGVMSGHLMLSGWKGMHAVERYINDHIDIWNATDDEQMLSKIKKFREWYEYPRDIGGAWYLWCIRNLFKDNLLIQDGIVLNNKRVLLSDINVPVYILTGEDDDITLPEQSLALANKVSAMSKHRTIPDVGHIGVFMSGKSQPIWHDTFVDHGS